MNEKFIVIDATDDIVIGGFGNLEGNLGLLKYSYEEISQKMKENNNKEEDIRLVNSLLDSIRELQQENKELKKQLEAGEEQYTDLVEEKEELQEQLSSIAFQLEKQKKILEKANKKIEKMFDDGDENKVIDDLIEIQKILDIDKGE